MKVLRGCMSDNTTFSNVCKEKPKLCQLCSKDGCNDFLQIEKSNKSASYSHSVFTLSKIALIGTIIIFLLYIRAEHKRRYLEKLLIEISETDTDKRTTHDSKQEKSGDTDTMKKIEAQNEITKK